MVGNSLVVQWLGLCTFTAKGQSSIPGWGTKIPQASWRGWKKKKDEGEREYVILLISHIRKFTLTHVP